MRAGLSPYRQILDFNMPGAYWSEFAGMTLFGNSDLSWRLYDLAILSVLTLSAISVTSSCDWLAGLYAGILFALIHGSEGPRVAAERDEVMTMLVMLSYALVFLGIRYRRSSIFFGAALAFALGVTLKPTAAVFGLVLGFVALHQLRRQKVSLIPYIREICLATVLVAFGVLAFLLWRVSFTAFLQLMPLGRFYTNMGKPTFGYMLHYSTPRGMVFLLPLTTLLFFLNRSWENWKIRAVLGGVICGLVSYFVQSKGFGYHRYPFVAFALVWSGLEYFTAIRKGKINAFIGMAGILTGALLVAPFYLHRVPTDVGSNDRTTEGIVTDLASYRAGELQNSVQCLDGLDGCYSALYRLQLKQSTGLMGDQLLFSVRSDPSVDAFRNTFLHNMQNAPPKVIIETKYRFGDLQTLDKIDAWPAFASFLQQNYRIAYQRDALGYRIYSRLY